MKIKIKVKTILLLALSLVFVYLVIIPFASLEVARYYDNKSSDKAKLFYESFLSKSFLWNDSKALYEYGSGLIGHEEKFQILMGGWGGGGIRTIEDMEKGLDALEELVKKKKKSQKDMDYSLLAYPKLMNTYIQLQDPKGLVDWIKWGQKNDQEEIVYIADLYEGLYQLINRNYDLVEEIINKYEKDMDLIDYRYYLLKGEFSLWKGDLEEAKTYFRQGVDKQDYYLESHAPFFGSLAYESRDYWLDSDYRSIRGETKLKGKVEFNGKPMPFTEIYLQKDNGISSRADYLVGVTDINGEYETLGFKEGKYNLGIGLSPALLHDRVYKNPGDYTIDISRTQDYGFSFSSPFRLLTKENEILVEDNKFNLEWEEVPGADYYQVEVTSPYDPLDQSSGSIAFNIRDENNKLEIKDNRATFDMVKLNVSTGGYTRMGEDMTIQPTAILGSFIPGANYYFKVNAYNKDSKLISSSLGLRTYFEDFPKIKIPGQLTQGEKLIAQMKYEEALDFYEEILEKNPDHEEALLYLTRIHMVEYREGKKDYEKALAYAEKYDKLKGNMDLSYEVVRIMDQADKRDYKDLVGKVLEKVSQDIEAGDLNETYADYHLAIRNYDLAKAYLEKLDKHYDLRLIYVDLYQRNLEGALESFNKYKFDLYKKNNHEFIEAIEGINQEDLASMEYTLIQDLLDSLLSQREVSHDSYLSIKSKVKNPNLSQLLKEIAVEEHWLEYY